MFFESFSSALHIIYRYALCIMHTPRGKYKNVCNKSACEKLKTQMSNIRMATCVCVCVFSCSVVSDSLQPHRLQPTRLLCPWDFSRQEYQSGLPFPPPDGCYSNVLYCYGNENEYTFVEGTAWMHLMNKMLSKNEKPKKGTHCMVQFECKAQTTGKLISSVESQRYRWCFLS